MRVFAGIEILEGRCVRLRQGRFDEATVYSDDPVAVAVSFVRQGAEALHVVDLDGARLGRAKNLDLIYRIRESVPVVLQVGGGVRTLALAARLFDAGIDRIVFGTAASEDPQLVLKVLRNYDPERVAAALDVRDDQVLIQGRGPEASRRLAEVIADLKVLAVRWVVCTDVTRDGLLIGPNEALARQLVGEGFQVVIGGGIATRDDIVQLRRTGAAGCIIGTALYGGLLSVQEANEMARESDAEL
jgi:phosphoribosylformimino-5-aminoimidazole carboxamide ribotide isomerase